jgi:multimeric flavodoxin WrbA
MRKKVMPTKFAKVLECETPLEGHLKAVVLLGTLKPSPTLTNTGTLCEFLAEHLKEHDVETEIVRLVDYNILPGTRSRMGKRKGVRDQWPKILEKLLTADIIIFASPIWWGNLSSEMQRAIERMDELNDEILATGKTPLANKVAGIVITGGEDGVQHLIGEIANFAVWNGLTLPPAASLSWLEDKGEDNKSSLHMKFEKGYQKPMATLLARNLAHYARLLKKHPLLPSKEAKKQNLKG